MQRICSRPTRLTGALLYFLCVLQFAETRAQTFHIADPIDLGSNLHQIGDLSWDYTLGASFDTAFSVGGIIGKKDSVIIPEIREPFFDTLIIPEVKADTRTGLRFSGEVGGGTGLNFYADFNAGGLEAGTSFEFAPQILDLPTEISTGEFFRFKTTPGVVDSAAFNENLIELPSFEAGMDFYFDFDFDSRLEYGLFPLIPYNSTSFSPTPIHVNQSLVKFGYDLDPDSNGGVGTPPELVFLDGTPFEQRLGVLNNNEAIYEKQVSVEMSAEGDPIKRRLDIGSVQLVNPFGKGESALGPNERNLTIDTDVDDKKISYSYETPLVRMGLDLDGLATYFGTAALTGQGDSFTRIEESFFDDKLSVAIDLLDVKYGPEIGFRESVDIKPDFDVTVNFSEVVALKVGGDVSFTDTYSGKWSAFPEIALIGDQAVDVSVSFDNLTGEQTKRSAFYLTDYLELTLFELESLGIKGGPEISLPPLYKGRTSVLGSLLGEVELELLEQTETIEPYALNSGLAGSNSFTLTPTPSTVVYLASNNQEFSANPNAWKQLSDHTAPAGLANAKLVIATGDSTDQLITDLDQLTTAPTGGHTLVDSLGGALAVRGLVIPEFTTFLQAPGNAGRTWNLSTIVNDGVYETQGSPLTLNGLSIAISGVGAMQLSGPLSVTANRFGNNDRHGIVMDGGPQVVHHSMQVDQLNNEGSISVLTSAQAEIIAEERIDNSGVIYIHQGGRAAIKTPLLANEDFIGAYYSDALLEIGPTDSASRTYLVNKDAPGAFYASSGGTLRFTDLVDLHSETGTAINPLQFHALFGGSLEFKQRIRTTGGGVAEIFVDETSRLELNGVEVKELDGNVSLVNKGVVDAYGSNLFYATPDIPFDPEDEPRIIGINLRNEGTMRIHEGSSVGFKAEIANYASGGATLPAGTWELLGRRPSSLELYPSDGSVFSLGSAKLDVSIAYITNEDAYLGRIDFGDTNGDGVDDGYSAADYDTQLAVSEANVLLDGAAAFKYFTTLRENRGAFTLRNKNFFTTVGDLRNSGAINVELDAKLKVSGRLIVDEGAVAVDSTGVLEVDDAIEVIGGAVTINRPAGPMTLNSPWIIREKWLGEDEQGNDLVREARVSYGAATIPTLGPDADVLLEGAQAYFEPLAALNLIQGKLAITGGKELHLDHNLENQGVLELAAAGKLMVDGDFLTSGALTVERDSFLEVAGSFSTSGGMVDLNGVVQAASFTVDAGSVLTGSGRFAGVVENRATVRPGNSPGVLEILGDYSQTADGALAIDIAGAVSDIEHDELLISQSANLDGLIDVSLSGGYFLTPGQEFTILTAGNLIDGGLELSPSSTDYFELIVRSGANGSVALRFLGGEFSLPGDFDLDGDSDGSDFLLWQRNPGVGNLNDWYAGYGGAATSTGFAVPEPNSLVLLGLAAGFAGRARRRRGTNARQAALS
ncbi:MAG: PEP-CTERM sorting domain-containing protein [Planctomycetales bacterium]|nr:PEP-CTERM sorting domain-containing protein [Planctomycetales bacterium]